MRAYIAEVLKLPAYILPGVSYAYQIFNNFPKLGTKEFEKIYNNPSNAPKQGDIVFFGPWVIGVTGIAGHVTINWQADINNIIGFEQNWPTNSPCHLQKHSYRGIIGWLHRKV